MTAVVVYESMYGNTHAIAERITTGLSEHVETRLRCVFDLDFRDIEGTDLLVVGAPTHIHGLPSPRTRAAAADKADPEQRLFLEPDVHRPGIDAWIDRLAAAQPRFLATFDTRVDMPSLVTGRAAVVLARRLHRRGLCLIAPPESFLVDKRTQLLEGEQLRALAWGKEIAVKLLAARAPAD